MHQFNIEDTYGDLIHSNFKSNNHNSTQNQPPKYFQYPTTKTPQIPQNNKVSGVSGVGKRFEQHQIQNKQREQYQLNMSNITADTFQNNAIFGNPHPSNSKAKAYDNHNNFNTHDRPIDSNIADIHRGAGIAIGKNTRNKHVEIKNRKDPFHGSRDFQHPNHDPMLKKHLRDKQLNDYQMDPNRIARDINPNAEYMFNSHNDQIKQNEYQSMTGTDHLEPTYYDQNNYSGLEPDRMFLADTKKISNLYTSEANDIDASIGAYHTLNLYNRGGDMNKKRADDQTKQKRSFRNPKEEVNSNSKLWEFQFTPMTMPL